MSKVRKRWAARFDLDASLRHRFVELQDEAGFKRSGQVITAALLFLTRNKDTVDDFVDFSKKRRRRINQLDKSK